MLINKLCANLWTRRAKPTFRSQDGPEINLYRLISSCQSGSITEADKDQLLRRVICENYKIKQLWVKLRRRLTYEVGTFYLGNPTMIEITRGQLMKCCSAVIRDRVMVCIQSFDLNRLTSTADQDVLKLISAFITNSLHYRAIIHDIGLEVSQDKAKHPEISFDELYGCADCAPNPEQATIRSDIVHRIIIHDKALYLARNQTKLDAFIHESLADQNSRSARARQQKTRLKAFITQRWHLDEVDALLVVEFIELWLQDGSLRPSGEPDPKKSTDLSRPIS